MSATNLTPDAIVALARQALDIEAGALHGLSDRLLGDAGVAFVRAVQAMLNCQGRVVVMGMGKSGHVGRTFDVFFSVLIDACVASSLTCGADMGSTLIRFPRHA